MLRRFCRWCSDDGIRSAASHPGQRPRISAGETFEFGGEGFSHIEGSPAATRQIRARADFGFRLLSGARWLSSTRCCGP